MWLTVFLQGDFDTPLNNWVRDHDKALRKDQKPQPDTKEHRGQQGINLVIRGFVRCGLPLCLVEGNGKALLDEDLEKVIDKPPQHEGA